MSDSSSPYRPGCITVYAILIWLGGALFALGTFSLISEGSSAAVCGGIFVILAAVIGYGLWHMQKWSWWLVIILQSLSLLGSLFTVIAAFSLPTTSGEDFLSPLVSGAVSAGILYWFGKNRSLFAGEPTYRTVVGPNGETIREPVPPDNNKIVIIIVGIFLLVFIVPVVTIAILTLLGPQIGNVFSGIVQGLESTPVP